MCQLKPSNLPMAEPAVDSRFFPRFLACQPGLPMEQELRLATLTSACSQDPRSAVQGVVGGEEFPPRFCLSRLLGLLGALCDFPGG